MEKLIVLDSDTYHLVKGIDEADHAGICAPMLTASHFAFMRAVFQGIDLHTCWRRYLATCDAPGTTQDIRRTIDRVTVVAGAYEGCEPLSRPTDGLEIHRMGSRLTVFARAALAT